MVALSVQIEMAGGLSWARWQRIVAGVERLGYRGLYCCDHFLPGSGGYADSVDIITAFTYLADHSARLEFGSLVAPTDMPYGDREADVTDPFGNNWYIGTRQEGGPVPAGLGTLTPTLHVEGTDRLIDFIQRAFGAQELDRVQAPDGTVVHAELKLGDSVLELGEARGFVQPMPTAIHYYVEDVDGAYASALAAYSNQKFDFRPLRAKPNETDVTVNVRVLQSGAQPVAIDYSMEKTAAGWKVYDVMVGGVSLVANYRTEFTATVRDSGIDGLIKSLQSKNRSMDAKK